MPLEQENLSRPEPLLRDSVVKAALRFPHLFTRSLYRSFDQMVVNSPSDFLSHRTLPHVRRILCVQFFLQKRMEALLQSKDSKPKHLFIKLFRAPSRVCVALSFSLPYAFRKEYLLKALDTLLPGISEIPRSSYLWYSPEYPYGFCYFEIDKLRGRELSTGQLRKIEKMLGEQMLAGSPLTPTVFWPYNKEESLRQIQILLREMKSKRDLPHVSIHFQEQTAFSLEFLVHLVAPKTSAALDLRSLPDSLRFFRYARHSLNKPFPIEIETFSIKMDPRLFGVCDTINLLYARRHLAKYLERVIGPFRDYNGGLFEKQQDQFELFRLQLASQIPYFDLFAEKVFYALHPFENWFLLPMEEVKDLFTVFAELIQDPRSSMMKSTHSGLFTVIKTENTGELFRSTRTETEWTAYAQLTLGNFDYECFSGKVIQPIPELQNPTKEDGTLRLIFQEGSPPSLNPQYSSGDMRCRLLNKVLFEGLTRLNEKNHPELAGASGMRVSEDGLTYTFRLRKAHWSNGERVTAFDYVDSWKWALQDLVSHPELLFLIKNARKFREKKCSMEQVGARAIDAETVAITLEEPDSQFLHKLAQPFFFPLFGTHREPKWFNGPYLVREWNKEKMKLELNPYFLQNRKEVFECIEVQWMDDIHEIYNLFQAGKVDWIGDPLSILSLEQIRELESERKLRLRKVFRRFSLHFNVTHPILSNVSIRQALSLSIDRSFICREIFPYSIPIEPAGDSSGLAAACFEQGLKELGLTRATFPALSFSYSNQTRRDQLALYLQRAWFQALGIQVHLERQNWNVFRSQLEKRNFAICGTIQDTLGEHSVSYLERFEGENSWNFAQWSHLGYREQIAAAKQEKNLMQQNAMIVQAEKTLSENMPFTPLFDYTHLYALHPRLECLHFDAEGCVDFSQAKRTGVKR